MIENVTSEGRTHLAAVCKIEVRAPLDTELLASYVRTRRKESMGEVVEGVKMCRREGRQEQGSLAQGEKKRGKRHGVGLSLVLRVRVGDKKGRRVFLNLEVKGALGVDVEADLVRAGAGKEEPAARGCEKAGEKDESVNVPVATSAATPDDAPRKRGSFMRGSVNERRVLGAGDPGCWTLGAGSMAG